MQKTRLAQKKEKDDRIAELVAIAKVSLMAK